MRTAAAATRQSKRGAGGGAAAPCSLAVAPCCSPTGTSVTTDYVLGAKRVLHAVFLAKQKLSTDNSNNVAGRTRGTARRRRGLSLLCQLAEPRPPGRRLIAAAAHHSKQRRRGAVLEGRAAGAAAREAKRLKRRARRGPAPRQVGLGTRGRGWGWGF